MATAMIHFIDPAKMIEIYVSKDIVETALDLLRKGAYHACQTVSKVTQTEGEDVAEELFDLTNNPSRQEEREHRYGRGRSLSVGDIVEFKNTYFLCAPTGWRVIDKLSV